MTFTVQAYTLPTIVHPASSLPLYPHQIELWNAWNENTTILLAAGTGTGKTRAAMLPVLKYDENAVAVYPTNELLRDQVRAVAGYSIGEGYETAVWLPESEQASDWQQVYSASDRILLPIDAAILDRWQTLWRCKSRGETLRRLLNPDGKSKIIFTNPDVLFLILALRYHTEPFEPLRSYQTLIVDEFHLYSGVELAHALAMVALARGFSFFRRFVLLSATPHSEVQALLGHALHPFVIKALPQPSGDQRTAVHAVQVRAEVVPGDPVAVLIPEILALRGILEHLRNENPDEGYIPAVVIVNSVVSAIRLEDCLVQSGFERESLAIIRGLSHRATRQMKGKLLALGTSAIEVGVDFHCDYLLFEASDDASFLQRFGRVGRHSPGRVIALVPPNVLAGMASLPSELDRPMFEEKIHAWYPSPSAYAWFVKTDEGMITTRSLGENLIATVARSGDSTPELVAELRERVEAILEDHAQRLGCEGENNRARKSFERSRAGKKHSSWLQTYCKLNTFRTSMTSLKVHDFTEQQRRRNWDMGEYEADILTLLKRAVGLKWNDKMQMLTIRGIGKYHYVNASGGLFDDSIGMIMETNDYPSLNLYQNNSVTPVSNLMARESHIFTVAPRAMVEKHIDWRLPVIEAGQYLLAFDGAALLLRSIWIRLQNKGDRLLKSASEVCK